jgi:cysteine synthase A
MYELIGETPMIKIKTDIESAEVYVKLEWFNPGGSVKDRIAFNMLSKAIESGELKPGDTIIEPTSGNTGIGLALVANGLGLKSVLVMPESLSIERRKILKGYGAELVLTEKEGGMKLAVEVANDLAKKHGYFVPKQFENPANPEIHYQTTSLEILNQVPGIDAFVAGVGTGGTITGVGRRLKEESNSIIVAVEPSSSPVLSGEKPGPHKIQGIGAGFIPDVVDASLFDQIIKVDDEDAFETARELAKSIGLFAGISTGANVFAALKVAKEIGKGKKVVTISPSNGERYLSTDLYK